MFRLLTLAFVLSTVGCSALTEYLQSDTGGDPNSGSTKGESIADGLAAGSPAAGPFAGIVLLVASVLSSYSERKKKTA